MKKPINNFALALIMLAILYIALTIPDVVEIIRQPQALQSSHDVNYVKSFAVRDIIVTIRATVYGSGVLFGLAAIVEVADRIRWALTRSKAEQ